MAITLQLPPGIERQLSRQWPDLPRKILEALAVESYRQDILTRSEVGQLLGLGRLETEDFLADRGASRPYNIEDFEQDMQANRRLLGNVSE
jgi:predicted HTH domain antitoxin